MFYDSCLEALGGEPLADIVHDQSLEDDLVAALVHTDLGARVSCEDIGLQCLCGSRQKCGEFGWFSLIPTDYPGNIR